jgi:hypothetical protein
VVLTSQDDKFLVNHMPDGSEWVFDMAFFKQLEAVRSEQDIERLTEELAAARA